MTAIISLLIVLTFSFFCTRLATLSLSLTGLSRELARLQSVSAFTGVGFTTTESEKIVNHPVRRRILILLMVVGNAGIVTAIASLILSFAEVTEAREGLTRFLWVVGGVGILWAVAASRWVEQVLDRAMRWALSRWTHLGAVDYTELLNLSGRYRVRVLNVESSDWVEGRRLDELDLFGEGISVLGIHRFDGAYVGVPRGETEIRAGDRLILYGRRDDLDELDERRKGVAGDEAHQRGIRQQSEVRHRQAHQEQERREQHSASGSSRE